LNVPTEHLVGNAALAGKVNATDFFEVGVHQDGLIHISQLADKFVQDPGDVVSVGDMVRVKILEVDLDRRGTAAERNTAWLRPLGIHVIIVSDRSASGFSIVFVIPLP
jgi:hypothetical protein